MSIHVIKYYNGSECVSQFVGDDETVATALFHMNFHCMLPQGFTLTKTDSTFKEYALRFVTGGYRWVEVKLNNPHEEL